MWSISNIDEKSARRCQKLVIRGGRVKDELPRIVNKFDFSSLIHLDYGYNESSIEDLKVVEDVIVRRLIKLQCIEITINATISIFCEEQINILCSFLEALSRSSLLLSCELNCDIGGNRDNTFEDQRGNGEKIRRGLDKVCKAIDNNRMCGVFKVIECFLPLWPSPNVLAQIVYDYLFGPMKFKAENGRLKLYEDGENELKFRFSGHEELVSDQNCIILEKYAYAVNRYDLDINLTTRPSIKLKKY